MERRRWYTAVAKGLWSSDWGFMNYGFHEDGLRIELPPERELERYSIQLYHHLASSVPLEDRDVLEVGCGRGGGAAWVHRVFRPQSTTAIDFVRENIETARRLNTLPGLEYQVGDAEALPFAEQSFDIVLNVESSHCYGQVGKFFSGTRTRLRPGGFFLYADFRPADDMPALERALEDAGFRTVRSEDITARVVAALRLSAPAVSALGRGIDDEQLKNAFAEFAALPGSSTFRSFDEGYWVYRSWVLSPD